MKRFRVISVGLLAALAVSAVVGTAPASAHCYADCAHNRQESRRLVRLVNQQARELKTLGNKLERANERLAEAEAQLSQSNGEVVQLSEGLPASIAGVGAAEGHGTLPPESLRTLVLKPLFAAWHCKSFFGSGSYWSYEFADSC